MVGVGLPSVAEQSRVAIIPAVGVAPPLTLVMTLLGGSGAGRNGRIMNQLEPWQNRL